MFNYLKKMKCNFLLSVCFGNTGFQSDSNDVAVLLDNHLMINTQSAIIGTVLSQIYLLHLKIV